MLSCTTEDVTEVRSNKTASLHTEIAKTSLLHCNKDDDFSLSLEFQPQLVPQPNPPRLHCAQLSSLNLVPEYPLELKQQDGSALPQSNCYFFFCSVN